MKEKIIIGIDPGTHTGFATWIKNEKKFLCIETFLIHQAIREVLYLSTQWQNTYELELVIEDARHIGGSGIRAQGAGSIKRDCSIWEDFAKDYQIPCRFVRPTKNSLTKLSPEKFKQITGWDKRTSEHARDAALLVFGM
jgi:hypothetical protein